MNPSYLYSSSSSQSFSSGYLVHIYTILSCMCACSYMCVGVHACLFTWVWEQRLTLGVSFNTFHLSYWVEISLWNPEFTSSTSLPSQLALRITSSVSHVLGLQLDHHINSDFVWALGICIPKVLTWLLHGKWRTTELNPPSHVSLADFSFSCSTAPASISVYLLGSCLQTMCPMPVFHCSDLLGAPDFCLCTYYEKQPLPPTSLLLINTWASHLLSQLLLACRNKIETHGRLCKNND